MLPALAFSYGCIPESPMIQKLHWLILIYQKISLAIRIQNFLRNRKRDRRKEDLGSNLPSEDVGFSESRV